MSPLPLDKAVILRIIWNDIDEKAYNIVKHCMHAMFGIIILRVLCHLHCNFLSSHLLEAAYFLSPLFVPPIKYRGISGACDLRLFEVCVCGGLCLTSFKSCSGTRISCSSLHPYPGLCWRCGRGCWLNVKAEDPITRRLGIWKCVPGLGF